VKLLKRRKVPEILLKLDISKAFNTVAWPFLLDLMQAWGFGNRWRDRIALLLLLSTASIHVLLDGQPGHKIIHRHGLRQSDPLSPMLFLLSSSWMCKTACSANKADDLGLLLPIGHPAIKHRCSMYGDDVILFASPAEEAQKRVLSIFGGASGLMTNLSKCSITPTYGAQETLQQIQAAHLDSRSTSSATAGST